MSLLLDALKRAEDAKRAKEAPITERFGQTAPPQMAQPLVPPPPREALDLQLSDFNETIPPRGATALDASALVPVAVAAAPRAAPVPSKAPGLAPTLGPAPAPREAPTARSGGAREEVKNVFVAKQSPNSGLARAKWLPPVLAVSLFAVGAGGWYVWQQTRPLSSNALPTQIATSRPAPPPALATAPATAPVAPSTTTATPNTAATNSATATQVAASPLPPAATTTGQPGAKAADRAAVIEPMIPPLLPPVASLPKAPAPKPTLAARAKPAEAVLDDELSERDFLAKQLRQARSAKEPPVGLKLSRSFDAPKLNPEIANAYVALSAGDFNQAKKLYTAALQAEPTSIDGHLGLATANARLGDNALAVQHYRRVLELDPRNSTAVNGLIAVSGTQPERLETELRALLNKDPNSAALNFSLGNVYAGERRWHEAQQSYFDAFRLQADNADYVYNLAVSLDKLNQTRLANDYYQKALQLSAKGGAQFDRALVQRRVDELRGG